jgi:hypothetical protein
MDSPFGFHCILDESLLVYVRLQMNENVIVEDMKLKRVLSSKYCPLVRRKSLLGISSVLMRKFLQ